MSEESVKNVNGTIEEVLGMMDRVNEVFSYEVWVPSLKRNVMFREINTSQQKRLIKAIIDSPIYNTEFIFTLRKVLKENCVDSSINVDELTIMDKLMIAMKMRSVSIGDKIEINVPLENGKSTSRGISLDKLINDLKDKINLPDVEVIKDDKDIYELECGIPTISTEFKLEDEMRKNTENVEIKDYDQLRQSVGDVFIGELAKFIRKISIKNEDQATNINLDDISFRNRISIIERLPEKLTKKVVSYIETVKAELDKVTLVKVNVGTVEEPKMKEEKFTIDASFFTSS